jgi:hypothetical protein
MQQESKFVSLAKHKLAWGNPLINETDLAVALICGGEILSKWRKAIQEAVSEGKNYKEFSPSLLPGSTANMLVFRQNSFKTRLASINFHLFER